MQANAVQQPSEPTPPPEPSTPPAKAKARNSAFTVPVNVLREAVAELKKVVRPNSNLPALGHILVERDRGTTTFTATDLDRWLVFTLPSEFPEPTTDLAKQLLAKKSEREDGGLLVPIKTLGDTIKNSDRAGDITFRVGSAPHPFLSYKFGGNSGVLDWEEISPDDFPSRWNNPDKFHPLPDAGRDAILTALPNASEDETRFIIHSVLLDCENHCVVATDGKSLTAFENLFKLPPLGRLVLHSDAVRLLAGRLAKLPWSIGIAGEADAPYVAIRAGNYTVQSRVVEGDYPNWRQTVPEIADKFAISLTIFSRAEIGELLKRLPKSDKSEHDPVRLDVRKNELRFSVGDSAFTVPVQSASPARTTNAHRGFWQRLVDLGATEFRFKDELSPIVGRNRTGMIFVFMPIRLSS